MILPFQRCHLCGLSSIRCACHLTSKGPKMIAVTLPDRVLLLTFKHLKRLEATGKLKPHPQTGLHVQETTQVRMTRCHIYEVKTEVENTLLITSTVRCDPRDQFSKEKGRKYALRDAIRILIPAKGASRSDAERQLRQMVWTDYFNRTPFQIGKVETKANQEPLPKVEEFNPEVDQVDQVQASLPITSIEVHDDPR